MTVPAALLRRLAVLEDRGIRVPKSPVKIPPDATVAELADLYARELEVMAASSVDVAPAKVIDQAELDQLATQFGEMIGARIEEPKPGKPTTPKGGGWKALKARAQRVLRGDSNG
jgi:hypothetical protein